MISNSLWQKIRLNRSFLKSKEIQMNPTAKEKECFDDPKGNGAIEDGDVTVIGNDRIQAGNDADVCRIDDNTIIVSFANGGHIRIVSETPIRAFCKPD